MISMRVDVVDMMKERKQKEKEEWEMWWMMVFAKTRELLSALLLLP